MNSKTSNPHNGNSLRPASARISVVINTYNAERHLREVLESVRDFDEIVVCDMESTDHTLDIAREYGCHIVTFPKGDCVSAEPARNFAIQSAACPWVLVVDADEVVMPALRDYLYQRVGHDDGPQGLYLPRRNRFMNIPEKGRIGDWQLRFFPREGTDWPPYVHTFPKVQGRTAHMPRIKGAYLDHLAENYIADVVNKGNQYTTGEVDKKLADGKHYGFGTLLWRPFWRFFKDYFLDGSIRSGLPGLIHALIKAYYQFLIVAKMVERQKKKA